MNPGIRNLVMALNAAGFMTCDSGDGETHEFSCDRDYGYVVVRVPVKANLISETDRLADVLRGLGIVPTVQGMEPPTAPNCYLQASYDPSDGVAIIDISYVHDRMILR